MTARSIRRAIERKAKKAALKAEKHLTAETIVPAAAPEAPAPRFTPSDQPVRHTRPRPVLSESLCWNHESLDDSPAEEPKLFTPAPLSAAQLAANRANAQLSSGPSSPEGKATASLNAVKTALTGRTVLLSTDDAPAYERHLRAYADDLRPSGARECDLVQSIADSAWRLKRIPCLETALFAQGHIEFAEAFNDHDPSLRASMIEFQTYLKYEKQLRNLQLRESRLARRREKEMNELRQLQKERGEKEKQDEREALEIAAKQYLAAKQSGVPFEPAANGFVFSTAQIEEHLERLPAPNMPRMTSSGDRHPAPQAPQPAQQAA